jgi:hypothetical protein
MNYQSGLGFPRFRDSLPQKMMKVVIIVEVVTIVASIKAAMTNVLAIRATDRSRGSIADIAGIALRIEATSAIDD